MLFSQPGCEFCAEAREHYLRPMLAAPPGRIAVAEFELNGARRIEAWRGTHPTEAAFAHEQGVRFAPTVMLFGATGAVLAPPIVGLSRDFFGAYLEQRIETARKALS